jgi:hypothetical protein
MSYRDLPPAIIQLNSAFDRVRGAHQLRNDRELAQYFNLNPKTISLLRNGNLSKVQAAIISALTGDESILKSSV